MRARARHLRALILVGALALSGCDAETEQSQGIDPPPRATGVITSIKPADGPVEAFVLETEDKGSLEVTIDREADYGFDLAHLHEHLESGDPVTVELEGRDGAAYARSIEDV